MEMASDCNDHQLKVDKDKSKIEQGPRQTVLAMWNRVLMSDQLTPKLELSQLLLYQYLTKRTQYSFYQIFYTTYTTTTWSVHYFPTLIM